jgi:hypothetical protein
MEIIGDKMLWLSIAFLITSILINVINAQLSVKYHVLRKNSLSRSKDFQEISIFIEILFLIASPVILACIGYWYLAILSILIWRYLTKYLFAQIALKEIDGTIINIYPSISKELINKIVGCDEISSNDSIIKLYEYEYHALKYHLQEIWGKDFIISNPPAKYLLRHASRIALQKKIKERMTYFQKINCENNR